MKRRGLLNAFLVLAWPGLALATNLAEVIAAQVEAKDQAAKAATAATFPPQTPPVLSGSGSPARALDAGLSFASETRPEDFQLIGVYGLDDKLRGLLCMRNSPACTREAAITVTVGQRMSGWTLVALSATSAIFERQKGTAKAKKPELVEIFLVAGSSLPSEVGNGPSPRDSSSTPLPLVMPRR